MWRGAISFGLVNIGVRLYPATRHLDVRFREVDRASGERLRHQRVRSESPWPAAASGHADPSELSDAGSAGQTGAIRPAGATEPPRVTEAPTGPTEPTEPWPTGGAVPAEEVVKGFEFERDRYVTVTAEELESLAPERTRTIDIEQFAAVDDVDPVYFDTSYYVVPDLANVRSFAVLAEGMRETRRLALSWVVLRRKRHLAALREHDGVMVMTTMFHADEVLPYEQLRPALPQDLSSREREMARLLIETLSGPFEPERYRDEYRERLLGLLEERAASRRTPITEPQRASSPSSVEDLMAALQASVERARREKADSASPPARRAARRGRRGA
jgi:DNA end-binding protein Ku